MSPKFAKLNRTFHWISSAFGLATLVFFSITGITLNHPDWFSSAGSESVDQHSLPTQWLAQFNRADDVSRLQMLTVTLQETWDLPVPRNIDHDEYEWVFDYQHPGGVTTVILDLETGELTKEKVNDGFVALINDLHKGRHSGAMWSLLIDLVAIICVVFSITGLILLVVHARKRRSTWPLVSAGLILPLLCYWLFVPS